MCALEQIKGSPRSFRVRARATNRPTDAGFALHDNFQRLAHVEVTRLFDRIHPKGARFFRKPRTRDALLEKRPRGPLSLEMRNKVKKSGKKPTQITHIKRATKQQSVSSACVCPKAGCDGDAARVAVSDFHDSVFLEGSSDSAVVSVGSTAYPEPGTSTCAHTDLS